jgi:predicted nucleotidyltransferase
MARPSDNLIEMVRTDLIGWAERNGSVKEMWLFGSRAKGTAREASDVDIGLALMPPVGDHNWALGNYYALDRQWKLELEAIVDRHLSLEPMVPNTDGDAVIRRTGIMLWSRP